MLSGLYACYRLLLVLCSDLRIPTSAVQSDYYSYQAQRTERSKYGQSVLLHKSPLRRPAVEEGWVVLGDIA